MDYKNIDYVNLNEEQKKKLVRKQGKYSINDVSNMTQKEINENWEHIKDMDLCIETRYRP